MKGNKTTVSLERLGTTSEIILESLAVGGVLSGALLMKCCTPFFMQGKNGWRTQADFIRAIDNYTELLIQRGIIIKRKGAYQLTEKGRWEASRRRLFDLPREHTTQYWDNKWRVVIFDIPETNSNKRTQLRRAIAGYGMYQLQKSVWVYPYSCSAFVDALKVQVGLSGEVLFLLVESIENQSKLQEEFGLD